MKKLFTHVLVAVLCLIMVLGVMPVTILAMEATNDIATTNVESNSRHKSTTHDVFSKTTSTLAPGIQQDIVYAYAKADGEQMVFYTATIDLNHEHAHVYANYKDNQCNEFGMAKLTEQLASAQAKHTNPDDPDHFIENYTAVGGINADFYNMTTGRPSGAFAMEGTIVNNANGKPFFAILNDGTAVIDYPEQWDTYRDRVVEAVGGNPIIVWDGEDVTGGVGGSYNTDRHSRSMVGITADGKVVMAVVDGRQEPFSCGGTMHELAQIMLEAGCVTAMNLDGGGSTTFAARQEGANEITIVNRPSDGSERSISNSLMFVSTTPPSDSFDHAVLTPEHDYVTPNSVVGISAVGVSAAGTAANIPDGVTWQLKDASFGTVDNAIFKSTGKTGDAIIQLTHEGQVIGETIVHVVIPDQLAFQQSEIVAPYGKSVSLRLLATSGLNHVHIKPSDVTFVLTDPTIGTIDGFTFTAANEDVDVSSTTLTASLTADASVTATATVRLGKGSQIIWDFEDAKAEDFKFVTGYPQYGPRGKEKDENGNYYYNGQNELGRVEIVTAETGKVRSGNKALALHCDFSQVYETGYVMLRLIWRGSDAPMVFKNAKSIGFWAYLPDEALALNIMRGAHIPNEDSETGYDLLSTDLIDTGYVSTIDESRWQYIEADVSTYDEIHIAPNITLLQIYLSDRDGSQFGYYYKDHRSIDTTFTVYIDDYTVDYSEAVEDRELPIFTRVTYADQTTSDAQELNGQTVHSNIISFGANVNDDTSKSNYSGINPNSAKAYIDGFEVACNYLNGIMSVPDITLADGTHSIRFTIEDNQGNFNSVIRTINIQAESDIPTIKVVPKDTSLDRIPIGSVYYIDITATNIEDVQSVETVLDLNNISTWCLEHMDVAPGFAVTYDIDPIDNIATLVFTRTGYNVDTGEGVLASIPIRTWISRLTEYEGYENQTPDVLWQRKIIWSKDISVEIDKGLLQLRDGTKTLFSGPRIQVDTELYGNYAALNANGDYANKKSWHVHENPVALDDLEPTCTTNGYLNRTYCEVCNSVIDWGTTLPAIGHQFEIDENNVLKCIHCGELYQGEFEGRTYVNGVVAEGWVDDSYYIDGNKLTGIHLIDGFYYDFGEDGVCPGRTKYTGFIYEDDKIYYAKIGVKATGWIFDHEYYYYFDPETFTALNGDQYIDGKWYEFDNYILVDGHWVRLEDGHLVFWWAGELQCNRWLTVKGKTYHFDKFNYAATGTYLVHESHLDDRWYVFDDLGVLQYAITDSGLWEHDGDLYYLDKGRALYAGLVQEGEDYYYFNSTYKAVTGRYWVSKTNGLMDEGYYDFDDDHKMILETGGDEQPKNGLVYEEGYYYYYENGVRTYAGLIILEDGNYYYINSSCRAVTGHYWVFKTNGLMPEGYYDFDDHGRMIRDPEPDPEANGLIWNEEDGVYYYYERGVKTYAGLIILDGHYYYINSSCRAVTGHYWVFKTNGLLPEGYYNFADDGKMIIE